MGMLESKRLASECMSKATIFLDIDGVLYGGSQKRHRHSLRSLYEEYAGKYPPIAQVAMSKQFNDALGTVVYDFDEEAIANLKELINKFEASIVITSDWRRNHSFEVLQCFFDVHGLRDRLVGCTPYVASYERGKEVAAYIKEHPLTGPFVIIDDNTFDFLEIYPQHFVHTYEKGADRLIDRFGRKSLLKAIDVLEMQINRK